MNTPPFLSQKELLRTLLWAAVVCIPLCIFGFAASMALAHSGGALLVLFIPTWPVFALFGSGGPFAGIPEWLFALLVVSAQFLGTFVVVHACRIAFIRAKP